MRKKILEQKNARMLRKKKGMSVKQIAKKLKVSQGSVSIWVRDIELTDKQKDKLNARIITDEVRYKGVLARKRYNEAKKREYLQLRKKYQEIGRNKIKKGCSDLYKAGCMLYWGEGSKTRNTVKFSNTDINLMKFFINFLKTECDVEIKDIKFNVNCYLNNGLTINDIETFWIKELKLKKECVRKHKINIASEDKKNFKKNVHKYGICYVSVNSTALVQQIYGSIQELGGFENSDWLW